MSRVTYYEWVVEHVDEHDDIHDTFAAPRLTGVDGWLTAPEGMTANIVLVRNSGDGWQFDRGWAYVEDGELPEEFDNGVRVPKRFAEEYARWRERRAKA